MDNIYSSSLWGLRCVDLAEAISEVLHPHLFIFSTILKDCTIYHDSRGFMLIKKVPMSFPNLLQRTPVFKIIKALLLEQYNELKQWMLTKHL